MHGLFTQKFAFVTSVHDDVIKWKHFPCYWPFVRGIHRSPVNSQHKGQWREALVFSLICTPIWGWVNNREAGELRCHCTHYDVIVMLMSDTSDAWYSIWNGACTLVCHCSAETKVFHYTDVIMSPKSSQITSVSIVCSTVCSRADQRKLQSSTSVAFMNSPHKGSVMRKMFPFDDVIMQGWLGQYRQD